MTISPISLGNTFTNSSGATVLGGLSSGLNTQSVINGIVAAQSAQITPLQDQITVNNNQASALTTLQNLLQALQTAAAQLANPHDPDASNNVWATNTVNVTSNTTQAASNFLTASAASGTAAGTYTISDITSIASATTQQSAAFSDTNTSIVVASGAAAGQFNAGTLTIAGPNGSASVTLNAGDTLAGATNSVVADFNAVSGTTGLAAAVTESNGVYTLGFTDTSTGEPVSLSLNDSTYGLTSDASGVFSAEASGTYTVAASSDAVVVASGATAGELNAGTFTLQGPGGTNTVTLTTGESLDAVAAAITGSGTGITATVSGTSGAYTLSFTNTSTGDPITVGLTDPPAIVTSDPSGVLNAQTQVSPTYSLDIADAPVVVASGATGNQFTAGTIDITGPGGSGVVTLHAGDTLSEVASDFNDASASTGISASLLQTSPGQYTLVFTSTTTGAATTFNLGSDTTVTGGTGTLSSAITTSGLTNNGVTAGTDAVFDLNGTPIDRSTNNITDLISGVTLNLLQNTNADAGASFTLTVAPDTTGIEQGIANFASAYNNVLSFYATQTQLNSSGTAASAAVLYSDTTLRSVYDSLTNEASAIVQGLSANATLNSLASLGISFTTAPASGTTPSISNSLSINSSTLLSALQNNLSGVEDVFGSNITATSSGGAPLSDIALYQSPSVAGVTSFTLNVNESGTSTITYTDPTTGNPVTVDLTQESLGNYGVSLTVPAGSGALAGMQLIYGSTENASGITVNLSQGVADQMNNFITSALQANTGLIAEDQAAIAAKTTSNNTQITNITNQVATTRQQLLQEFANLESAINAANSSLDLLNAEQNASTAASGG